ncbi:MAG: phosphoglycerate dehydrogenase [Chloroflexi bacterium]|nr:phosphoglycerate dehydrogenase [Chloroflexota bacterium]
MNDLKSMRVLVTPTSYGRHDPRLLSDLRAVVGEVVVSTTGKPLTSSDLRALLPGIHGMIAGLDTLDAAALASADCLRVIARYGIGVERVDLRAAEARGIVVCNTPGANSNAVAELTVGFLIALARALIPANTALKQGSWLRVSGVSLEGKTIGLIGYGAIGKRVAGLMRMLGCTVIAHDPYVPDATMREAQVVPASLDDLLRQSDYVSLHLPVTDDTRGMVNTAFLSQMKRGASLINTARGELIDDDALIEALNTGQLGGAALDAFTREPPAPDDALIVHPNVIVTPHIGGNTDSATNAMGWMALQECLAVLRGEPPQHRVI